MTTHQKHTINRMRRQGIPYAVIARKLGLSTNTVKSFCHRKNISVQEISDISDTSHCRNCRKNLAQSAKAKPKIFCSDKCRYAWWNHHRRYSEQKYLLRCHGCSNEFTSYGNKHKKYCSRSCYANSRYGEGLP